jgi:hypothetical protein
MPVAVHSGSLLHRASHSSCQWQSIQAACYTEPATLHTSDSPIGQPVTRASHSSYQWQSKQAACDKSQPLFIPVADQSGSLFQEPATLHASGSPIRQPVTRASHSSYQWQSNQAACYKSQPLFMPVAVQSGSLFHYLSFLTMTV